MSESEQSKDIYKVKEMSKTLSEVTSHPEFLKVLQKIQDTPEVDRMEYISKNVTPNALAEKGIPIPPGFRLTTRVFEDPNDALAEYTEDVKVVRSKSRDTRQEARGGTTICGSVGFMLCVSVGKEV